MAIDQFAGPNNQYRVLVIEDPEEEAWRALTFFTSLENLTEESAMLNTPAAMALMNDPQALGDLINNNPQLVALAMQNPQTLTMLMSNPEVSGLVGKFDTSKIKKF